MVLKINFSDFWKKFNPNYNWFINFLREYFEVELSSNPDFLIYSCYGERHKAYNCIKIFYTPENVRPNFNYCDYALTFDFIEQKNHFRLPLYGISYGLEPEELLKPKPSIDEFLSTKKEFCAMVVSNERCLERLEFFKKLSKYKKVHSGGKVLNNIGSRVTDKIKFISNFRFTFAFENSSYPGYVTEKIYEPMFVNSIPIYWGSTEVNKDFNTKSFLNVHDFSNTDDVIARLMELESDKYKLHDMLKESWFHDNRINDYINRNNILTFFNTIFTTPLYKSNFNFKSCYYNFKFQSKDNYRHIKKYLGF